MPAGLPRDDSDAAAAPPSRSIDAGATLLPRGADFARPRGKPPHRRRRRCCRRLRKIRNHVGLLSSKARAFRARSTATATDEAIIHDVRLRSGDGLPAVLAAEDSDSHGRAQGRSGRGALIGSDPCLDSGRCKISGALNFQTAFIESGFEPTPPESMATSSCERNRSAQGHIHSEVRNGSRAESLVYIYSIRKAGAAVACDDTQKMYACDNE